MRPYTPENWIWKAADGRVFLSATSEIVTLDDGRVAAWMAAGAPYTPTGEPWPPSDWPPDANGQQTAASLQDVLSPHGLYVNDVASLAAYANLKQWALATGGFTITLSGQVRTFATSEVSMTLMNGKFLRLTQANPPATISWQFATGFEDVSMADFVKAAVTISDFVQATFDALKPILAAIAAGTITTADEIEAAAWPSATAS